jgi:hypothetical protein
MGGMNSFGFGNSGTGNFGVGNSGGVTRAIPELPAFISSQLPGGGFPTGVNFGIGNSGLLDTGVFNSGVLSTGVGNAGDLNTGNWNAGAINTGNGNSGLANTGLWNSGIANTGFGGIGDTGQHISGFGNTEGGGTLGQGFMSGFFNTASGFNGVGSNPLPPILGDPTKPPFTNTFTGDVSGIMNHVSGGGAVFPETVGPFNVQIAVGLNGFTSGYFNTGFPGTTLQALSPLVAGLDSGVNNFGTFVPGLFSVIPTLQNLLG